MNGTCMRSRIAICTEYGLSLRGGVSVLVEELIRGLGGDFEVWLVSPDSEEEVSSHSVGSLLAGHIQFHLSTSPPSSEFREQAVGLVRQLQEKKISLVHFHCGGTFGWGNRWMGPSIPEFCAREGIKVIWTGHSTQSSHRAFIAKGRPRWMSMLVTPVALLGKIRQIRAVDAEIAVSDYDRRFVKSHYPSGKAIHRIYHSRLGNESRERKMDSKVILSVGHITFRKGHDVLAKAFLKAASQLPDCTLDFLGHDGGDGCWQAIEAFCAEHPDGSRIRLLGEHPVPAERMLEASIFVQPSREEALGLALQEAIYLGCAAIGSKVGGIPEVIQEGETGLLVPPEDPDSLADALIRLASDQPLRREMSKRGRDAILAKGMTAPRMVEAHRKLYLELLASR